MDSGRSPPALAQRKSAFLISEVLLHDTLHFPLSLQQRITQIMKSVIYIIILTLYVPRIILQWVDDQRDAQFL